MARTINLYRVSPTKVRDEVHVEPFAAPAIIDRDYVAVCTAVAYGKSLLFAYDGEAITVFESMESSPFVAKGSTTSLAVGAGWDIVDTFVLGNRLYLVHYRASSGAIGIREISRSYAMSEPANYARTRDPISTGFTTLKSFTFNGSVFLMGYNGADGHVTCYAVSVVASSRTHVPPIAVQNVWSHFWAQGWTRFAFFQLGGENFFLKTNTWRPNVNIDHVLDDVARGTIEVTSHMNLERAQELDVVHPLTLGPGDPYFLTYERKTGALTIDRIHGDCAGWTRTATVAGPKNAEDVVPVADGQSVFLLCT